MKSWKEHFHLAEDYFYPFQYQKPKAINYQYTFHFKNFGLTLTHYLHKLERFDRSWWVSNLRSLSMWIDIFLLRCQLFFRKSKNLHICVCELVPHYFRDIFLKDFLIIQGQWWVKKKPRACVSAIKGNIVEAHFLPFFNYYWQISTKNRKLRFGVS